MPLFWLSLAFLGGIAAGQSVSLSPLVWLGAGAAAGLLLLGLRRARGRAAGFLARRHASLKFPPLLLLAAFCLGGLRMAVDRLPPGPDDLAYYTGREAAVTGWVAAPPRSSAKAVALRVEAARIQLDSGEDLPVRGAVQVLLAAGPSFAYGERLTLRGILALPPESGAFSYREVLARQGVFAYLAYPQVERLGMGGGSPVLSALYTLRERARAVLRAILPAPPSALLEGILLGDGSAIPDSLERAFQATGTAHVLVISGFNMAVLAGLFSSLFSRAFSRWTALPVSLTAIGVYTLFVGASPAVLRAAVMSALALVAIEIGRPGGGLNALFFTAGVMCLGNPFLLWDVSFQLSFAATLGLVLYAARLQGWFTRIIEARWGAGWARRLAGPVGEYFLFTLAAQAFTLPVIAYHFGRLSLSAVIANPLILPAQPPLMLLGGLAVLLGLVWLPLGQLAGWAAWAPAAYTAWVPSALSGLPWGELAVPGFGALPALLWLGALCALAINPPRLRPLLTRLRPAIWLAAAGLLAAFAWRAVLAGPGGNLHLWMLNLDGETAVLLQSPEGRTLLVDGGPDGSALRAALGNRLPPDRSAPDVLLLTTSRAAVLSATAAALADSPPDRVLWAVEPPASQASARIAELGGANGVEAMQAGQTLALDGEVRVRLLGGGAALLVEYRDLRVLLPGRMAPAQAAPFAPGAVLLSRDAAPGWAAAAPQAGLAVGTPAPPGWAAIPAGSWAHLVSDGRRLWLTVGEEPRRASRAD